MKKMVIPILFLAFLVSCGGPEISFRYGSIAQTEIQGPEGRVFIDVIQNEFPSTPFTEDDILVITHGHFDHYERSLVDNFPGEKIVFEKGRIERDGLTVTVIPSAHNEGDEYLDEGGSNYVVLVETGGMRILHTGDIGQESFTGDQLEQFGQIDVYFGQLENSFSNVNLNNRIGFNLINQLKPSFVVPTHYRERALDLAAEEYPMICSTADWTTVKEKDLPSSITLLIVGDMASVYQKIYDAELLE